MSEQDLSKLVRRANEAKQLLENPLFTESLDVLRTAYTEAACKCDAKDDLARFRFIEGLKMVEVHKTFLRAVMEQGSLAQSELDALEREKGVKRFIPKF